MANQSAATAEAQPTAWQNFSKGLLTENPSLRQMLGLCPTLAVTTAVSNGLGMGLATTFVLVCSGVVVSLLRKVIPNSVRIPAFITIIASFVTLTMMIVEAYLPALNDALGIYLPLIVVNCIVLGRAEMFASKNPPLASAIDGLGMGVGFTISLTLMSAVRELLGAGTLLGVQVMPSSIEPMIIMVTPPGGFAVLGVLIAASVALEQSRARKEGRPARIAETPCDGCAIACGLGDPADPGCTRDVDAFVEKVEAALEADAPHIVKIEVQPDSDAATAAAEPPAEPAKGADA